MKNELNLSFGIFYVSAYLLVMLLGIGCFLWHDELIFLLGFAFFGCFIAARIAMGAVLAALQAAVPSDAKDPVVIINADAKAAHQRVIDVMQAAQQAGLVHISFATQAAQQ